MADLTLTASTVPINAVLPTSAQQLVNFVAAYLGVSSTDLANIEGIIISPTAPTNPADRSMAWLQTNGTTGTPIAINIYNGGWQPLPSIVQAGAAEPSSPPSFSLFYNTTTNTLEFFNGSAWTSTFWPSGPSANRPTAPAIGYTYQDTTIGLLLRFTASGWSTVEGAINEIKMIDNLAPASVPTAWPGWIVHPGLAGNFAIGADSKHALGSSGGRTTVPWTATGASAQGGSRDTPLLSQITIDGTTANGVQGAGNSSTANGTIDITPPWYGVTYIMKSF